jgi:micrococcal nuclease
VAAPSSRSVYLVNIIPAAIWGGFTLIAGTLVAQEPAPPAAPVRTTVPCVIARVIDGDTVHCFELGTVRLIGMDTPERNQPPFGAQSADALAALAPQGDTVWIERDVSERDRYGRMLGYLWKSGELLNYRLVREGWAMTLTVPPNVQYVEAFVAAQRLARAEGVGLWAVNGFECSPANRRARRC